jgi:transposase
MMLVEKYANHQPLNRQSEHYAREGIELSVSTMADHVGACAATTRPSSPCSRSVAGSSAWDDSVIRRHEN